MDTIIFDDSGADEKPKYLRWHPAKADSISFRGDDVTDLNRRTFELIWDAAIAEDAEREHARQVFDALLQSPYLQAE